MILLQCKSLLQMRQISNNTSSLLQLLLKIQFGNRSISTGKVPNSNNSDDTTITKSSSNNDKEKLKKEKQNALSKMNSFINKIETNFQETRRKQEDQAVAAKKISPELRKRASDFFERDVNEAQRKVLLDESFRKSYYHDAKLVATKGAKLWEAKTKLSSISFSPRIPAFEGTTMDQKPFALHRLLSMNKVVLVGVFFNQFGESHVKSFMQPFVEKYTDSVGKVGMMEINVNENSIKSPLIKFISPYIRWTLPKERRKRYMILHENIQAKSKAMKMENTVLGWVHLVDANGFIRWQAHGIATEKELETLFNLTTQLIKSSN